MEEPAEQNDVPDEEQASTSTNEKIIKIQMQQDTIQQTNIQEKLPTSAVSQNITWNKKLLQISSQLITMKKTIWIFAKH